MYYYICVHKQLKINDMEADFKKGTKVCNKCGRELPISCLLYTSDAADE